MNAVTPTPELINAKSIRTDGGTQSRAQLYANVVTEYIDALAAGAAFPPVIAFFDGSDYWLADGFHRHAAYMGLGRAEIPVDVRQGTRRDATLFSVGANASHGLRRTNDDKRRAVMVLLNDPEWSKWSDREISRAAAVGNKFVGDMRRSLCPEHSDEPRTYTNKHGTTSTMNTANIGSGQRPAAPLDERRFRNEYEDREGQGYPSPPSFRDPEPEYRPPAPKVMNPKALWVWGRIKDFEREGILRQDPAKLLTDMTEPMRADMRRFLPEVVGFLTAMEKSQ